MQTQYPKRREKTKAPSGCVSVFLIGMHLIGRGHSSNQHNSQYACNMLSSNWFVGRYQYLERKPTKERISTKMISVNWWGVQIQIIVTVGQLDDMCIRTQQTVHIMVALSSLDMIKTSYMNDWRVSPTHTRQCPKPTDCTVPQLRWQSLWVSTSRGCPWLPWCFTVTNVVYHFVLF